MHGGAINLLIDQLCVDHCWDLDYKYAGVEYGKQVNFVGKGHVDYAMTN